MSRGSHSSVSLWQFPPGEQTFGVTADFLLSHSLSASIVYFPFHCFLPVFIIPILLLTLSEFVFKSKV